jgi:AcrR family transcriptional regulator
MTKNSANKEKVSVRDRLLDAADRLFYQEGVRAVGIDRVLAEANAAKASLYSHFGCKDDLIAAYVKRRADAARESIDAFVEMFPPEERALRVFDFLAEWAVQADFRGCPIRHVVGELSDCKHPARELASRHRTWLIDRFTGWARAAGASDPKRMGGALLLLFDGAVVAAEQEGPARVRDARWAAASLLGLHSIKGKSGR